MGMGYRVVAPRISPEELDSFREIYAAHMQSLLLSESFDYSTKSHLYEAVWIAASSPISLNHIMRKIFLELSLKDEDGEQLHLYDIAVDLAEDESEGDIEEKLVEALHRLFAVGV